jgi:TonB family protein
MREIDLKSVKILLLRYMKAILFTLLFCAVNAIALAQKDTTYQYFDVMGKPCPPEQANTYTIQHEEKGRWKKVLLNRQDKVVSVSYYADAAGKIQDGPYRAYNKNQEVSHAGQYVNNKKEGVWKSWNDKRRLIDSAVYKDDFIIGVALEWSPEGVVIDSSYFEPQGKGTTVGYWPGGIRKHEGGFTNGKRNGAWTYFHKNGNKSQDVNYLQDSAVSFTCYDEQGKVQTRDCYHEKEASFKGGDNAWSKYLSKKLSNTNLPKDYYNGKIYGTMVLTFYVDTDGTLKDVKVETPVHPSLDAIALDIVRSAPLWEPAVQFNRKVKAYRKQPITFPKAQ